MREDGPPAASAERRAPSRRGGAVTARSGSRLTDTAQPPTSAKRPSRRGFDSSSRVNVPQRSGTLPLLVMTRDW